MWRLLLLNVLADNLTPQLPAKEDVKFLLDPYFAITKGGAARGKFYIYMCRRGGEYFFENEYSH